MSQERSRADDNLGSKSGDTDARRSHDTNPQQSAPSNDLSTSASSKPSKLSWLKPKEQRGKQQYPSVDAPREDSSDKRDDRSGRSEAHSSSDRHHRSDRRSRERYSSRDRYRSDRHHRDRSPRRHSSRERSYRDDRHYRDRSPRRYRSSSRDRYRSSRDGHRDREYSPKRRDSKHGDSNKNDEAVDVPVAQYVPKSKVPDFMRKNISLKSIGVTVERPVAQAAKVVAEDKGKPMQIVLNDRLGKRVKIDCFSRDTIGQLKQLAAAKLGTRAEKIRLQKWKTIYKDHIRIEDYDISDGMSLEMYND